MWLVPRSISCLTHSRSSTNLVNKLISVLEVSNFSTKFFCHHKSNEVVAWGQRRTEGWCAKEYRGTVG